MIMLLHALLFFSHCTFNTYNTHFISLVQTNNCSLLHLNACDFPLKFLAPDHLLIKAELFTQGCVIARSSNMHEPCPIDFISVDNCIHAHDKPCCKEHANACVFCFRTFHGHT